MKKSGLLFLIFICLLITGCSQKNQEEIVYEKPDLVANLFNQLETTKSGKSDYPSPGNYIIPDFIYRFLTKINYSKDGEITNFERFNPDYITRLETSQIYDPSSDNGSWVEEVIHKAQMDGLFDEFESDDTFYEYEEDYLNQNKEIRFFDEQDEFKFLKFENETFIPQKIGDNIVFVNSSKSKVSRNIYDKDFRLIKREVWKEIKGELKRNLVEDYEYIPSTVKIASKTTTTDTQEEKTSYNDAGLVTGNEVYSIKLVRGAIQKSFVESSSWAYDSQKRVTRETFTEMIKGRRETTETRYKYKKENLTPDTDYYENGVLKIRTIYSTNSTYEKIIFFDEDMSVHTYYRANKKVKDIYYIGDLVLRENDYE